MSPAIEAHADLMRIQMRFKRKRPVFARPYMVDYVLCEAAARHRTTVAMILARCNKWHVVAARYCAIQTLAGMGYSISQIARWVGKHHTTVMYAINKAEQQVRIPPLAVSMAVDEWQ